MTIGILNWKICVKCGEPFDVGTNHDKCPACRDHSENKIQRNMLVENG